ncbi:hypothetical protein KVT40_007232 [Elsinoe batatas]|uniref:Translation machinery-associated protein 16 n=1 Tax=Elsinoe batatas TaxID=2601811 RepID=A0A8K0KWP2_9PEZI|nr:hypothetical protein KVT40_007232 [Elsinoe batatas]
MPSALNKVQKRISKKRTSKLGKSSSLNALHENSRDAQRIRRAAARDEKVIRGERERERKNDRFLKRLSHIHAALRLSQLQSQSASPPTMTIQEMHALISSLLATHTSALSAHVSARRPGRPKTRDHERAGAELAAEEAEYESGFWMVDLRKEENVRRFERWDGKWEGLGGLEFIRVRRRRGGGRDGVGNGEGEGGMEGVEGGDGGEDWEETVIQSRFPPTGAA